MKKRIILLAIIIVIILSSLLVPSFHSEPIFLGYYRGEIVDASGLDGCEFLLVTSEGRFELVGYDGEEHKDVFVYYTSITSGISVCMVGQMIRVLFIVNIPI